MAVRCLILTGFILCNCLPARAQKLYGGHFERQAAKDLSNQDFSYRFACTFYADRAAKDVLPTQLKFRIFRKRDNQLIREVIAQREPDPPMLRVLNECTASINAAPRMEYFWITYTHETIITPNEFNDSEGYYIINEAPNVPRAQSLNVNSSKLVLYHWFSPAYLFDKVDNADKGKAISGFSGQYAYVCREEGKTLRLPLTISPELKFYDPDALDLSVRTTVPLTEKDNIFSEVNWQQGFGSSNLTSGDFFVYNSKPKFDNNSINSFYEAWTVPQIDGLYSLAFVSEQRLNGVKLSESSMEMYIEAGKCKQSSYIVVNVLDGKSGMASSRYFCEDKPIILAGKSTEQNFDYYQWYKDKTLIEGANSIQLKVTEPGEYFLRARKEGLCSEVVTQPIVAVAINCQTSGPPAILGNNLHDLTNMTGPTPTGYINTHSFRSIYYIPLADLPKMPSSLKAVIYRKRDNEKMDEFVMKHNFNADQTNNLSRTCDTGQDNIHEIVYDAAYEFKADRYNDALGYYMVTEPVCCRADADNLAHNGSSVVTYLEIGPANQVKANNTINRGHTVDLLLPFTMRVCVGEPARVFLYTGNRENITAQFGGFAELVSSRESGGGGFREMGWATGFSADNFTGNQKLFTVEARRNGIMVMLGTPEKPGVFVYRLRINGISQGKVYSSVFQEFRLEVDDCSPVTKPTIFVSKVGSPNIAASTKLCQDSLVQLNLKNFRKWGKLQWLLNDKAITNATDSILIVPKNMSGLYTCSVKMTRQCPDLITTDPTKIEYLPKPNVRITAPIDRMCAGNKITLSAQSNNEINSYQWFFSGQEQVTTSQSTYTATQVGSYSVRVIDTYGCPNTSLPYKILLHTPAKSTITSPNNKDYICEGDDIELRVPEVAGFEYKWLRQEQSIDQNKPLVKVNREGVYTVVVTDTLGCASTSTSFTVRQLANPSVSLIAPINQFCEGKTLEITAQTNANEPVFDWWLRDSIITNKSKSAVFGVKQSGSYAVSLVDKYGCKSNKSTFEAQMLNTVKVSIDTLPNLCGIASAPLALKGSPEGGEFAGVGVQNNNQFLPRVAGIGTHTITYTIKSNFECLSGVAQRTISIKEAPKLDLGSEREIYRGAKTKLNALMGAGYKYQWQPAVWIDNANIAQPVVAPDSTGYYWVTAIGPDGCVSEDSIFIRVIQKLYMPDIFTPNGDGINDTWRISGLEAYPEAEVTIYNRWGIVVFHEKGSNQKPFDGTARGEALPEGMYVYVVRAKPNGHIDRGQVYISR